MSKKANLLVYLAQGIEKLNMEFPQFEASTSTLFQLVFDFLDTDFSEMSDNRIYRHFLTAFKNTIQVAFASGVSKKYLRCFFQHLNDPIFISYLGSFATSRADDIRFVMVRFVDFFVATWQGYDEDRQKVLDHIVHSIDGWM